MSRAIVITSIAPPTDAVRRFAALPGCHCIVVADRKTPVPWHCDGVDLVSLSEQEQMSYALCQHLPYDHYARKMLGYLRAIAGGAEVVVDTDDDNIPKPTWAFPDFDGTFDRLDAAPGFVNVYALFTSQLIWPRGLPLDLIRRSQRDEYRLTPGSCSVGVWQGLADEDPDVDAIYRLTSDVPCYFNARGPAVLPMGVISPFNSQNTAIRSELFSLLYLPVHVTFRFTDILRSLVAQPVMAAAGFELGFTDATVVQKRNPHDYLRDFESEIPMYQHARRAVELVSGAVSTGRSIDDNLAEAYGALARGAVVPEAERRAVDAWLMDLQRLRRTASRR